MQTLQHNIQESEVDHARFCPWSIHSVLDSVNAGGGEGESWHQQTDRDHEGIHWEQRHTDSVRTSAISCSATNLKVWLSVEFSKVVEILLGSFWTMCVWELAHQKLFYWILIICTVDKILFTLLRVQLCVVLCLDTVKWTHAYLCMCVICTYAAR